MHGHQTVAVHTGPLSETADRWRCLWEVGHLIAVLDGVTSLAVAGLRSFDDAQVHVSVMHGCRPPRVGGVRLHRVVRRVEDEVLDAGIPRTKPAVAAARAAAWARTNRQAALILALTVQQGIAPAMEVLAAAEVISSRRRRRFIRATLRDLAGGAHSLGELDFSALCRRRGLPEPSRQEMRQLPSGRIYLDVRWEESSLVVEIDGIQHAAGLAPTADDFRQNDIMLGGDHVLRMTTLGLRLEPDRFMDQVCAAYERFRRLPMTLPG